jgi:DNA-binding winged helix-turn-helix (wHTH) protein
VTFVRFHFERFVLDPEDRQLTRDDKRVELSSRYFDALTLLVRERGKLISKDRLLEEVWRGVPVTDEALTQCIRTLRRQLGDEAGSPRFIETVPKHGYRFIAAVEPIDGETGELNTVPPWTNTRSAPVDWREFLLLGSAGTVGGGIAGLLGGIFYGFAGASQPLEPGMGAISVLLVLVCLTELVALIGGAGVGFGIAAAGLVTRQLGRWAIVGGAVGGLVVGAAVKLLGLDAFTLLFGRSPGDITGPMEGVLLGGAVGLGTWAAGRATTLRRGVAMAAVIAGALGASIPLLGGRMMGGSLDLLARNFAESRLRLDQIGHLFGEATFGRMSQIVTASLEAALFGGCVVGAMMIARRSFSGNN